MFNVRVKILGSLNKPMGKDKFQMELQNDACLQDLLLKAGYHQSHLRFFHCAVNGSVEKLGCALKDGTRSSWRCRGRAGRCQSVNPLGAGPVLDERVL